MIPENFIKGICSRGSELEKIKETGFNWIRTGFPFPYNPDGSFNEKYLEFKEHIKKFKENGLKVMTITPYPRTFIEYGADTRTPEGYKKTVEIMSAIAKDLQGLIDGWQVTNEMNVYFFRAPFCLEESVDFLKACLEGVHNVDDKVLLGFNFSEFSETSKFLLSELLKDKHLFNYVGYDGYFGTWIEGTPEEYAATIQEIYEFSGLPVIVQEFGFSSTGEVIQPGEFDRLLKEKYGYEDFEDAKEHYIEFLDKLPERMSSQVKSTPQFEWADSLFLLAPHLLKKWNGGTAELPHTPKGQADFFERALKTMINTPHLLGVFVFSWQDMGRCFFCHEEDCPCETAWGLFDKDGNPKPAYSVVKKYFSKPS